MTDRTILADLARRDARLFALKQQIQNIPRRIAELEAELKRLEGEGRDAGARVDQAEAARRKLENELQEVRQRRTKSEGRLATLTSTEQYQAVVKEIAGHGERIDALESAVLEAMERAEDAAVRRDAEVARVEQGIQVARGQVTAYQADLDAARTEMPLATAERDAVVQTLDAPTRGLYERVLGVRRDAGLALVHSSTCGICKAVQPPQVLQLLRSETGIQTCQMCGRILVWDGAAA